MGAGNSLPALVYGPRQTLAYTALRALPTFAVSVRVLSELSRVLPRSDFSPRAVLDFGSGPGMGAWCVLNPGRGGQACGRVVTALSYTQGASRGLWLRGGSLPLC